MNQGKPDCSTTVAPECSVVTKYEVGIFDNLTKRSVVGDKLDIHHAAQKHPAGQVIDGYDPKTAPSIAVPAREHRRIPTIKGEYSGNARDLLAKDIKGLRGHTNAPNSELQGLIRLNKETYPGAFNKQVEIMNSEQFISIIKKVVRECAIEDTIENLEDPPGRKVSEAEQLRSDWFNGLSEGDRSKVESIVTDAVDEALFGLLSAIDGVRAIEDGENKGRLVLIHKGQAENPLNDPEKIGLHDLYKAT